MTIGSTRRVSSVPLRPREIALRAPAARRESTLWRLDWWLVLAVSALVSVGALLIWSATQQKELAADGDPKAFLKKGYPDHGSSSDGR